VPTTTIIFNNQVKVQGKKRSPKHSCSLLWISLAVHMEGGVSKKWGKEGKELGLGKWFKWWSVSLARLSSNPSTTPPLANCHHLIHNSHFNFKKWKRLAIRDDTEFLKLKQVLFRILFLLGSHGPEKISVRISISWDRLSGTRRVLQWSPASNFAQSHFCPQEADHLPKIHM
jgi:hypothetical protein